MRYVLDASAVLAVLNREPGANVAAERLPDAMVSAVNAVEVGTKLVDSGMSFEAAREAISLLRLPVADFDEHLAVTAIGLREKTKSVGLSLADRACLSLAIRQNATAVTADRAWSTLDLGCKIELIR